MIKGVKITPLKQISDDRGKVMHMLRSTDPHFEGLGEIYFSWINPEVIKAWKKHKKMTLNLAVPYGSVRVVIYDDRKDSKTYKNLEEFSLSPENYFLLTIPPGVWFGFKNLSDQPSMVVNCATIPHDPGEVLSVSQEESSIPYDWTENRD